MWFKQFCVFIQVVHTLQSREKLKTQMCCKVLLCVVVCSSAASSETKRQLRSCWSNRKHLKIYILLQHEIKLYLNAPNINSNITITMTTTTTLTSEIISLCEAFQHHHYHHRLLERQVSQSIFACTIWSFLLRKRFLYDIFVRSLNCFYFRLFVYCCFSFCLALRAECGKSNKFIRLRGNSTASTTFS